MRVLFTTIGSPSHGRTQLPLARALAVAGHEVLAITTPRILPTFKQDDIRVADAIADFSPSSFTSAQLAEHGDQPELDDEQRTAMMLRALSGPMAKMLTDAVLPVARDFRPDLILRDGMDAGACLVAELLGIPQLPTPSGAGNSIDPVGMLPGLNVLRDEYGLPTQDDPLSLTPFGRIDYVPPSFSFARHQPPSWCYRQTVDVDRRSVLPRWVAELPTDRPLVFAAIGTALPMLHEQMAGPDGAGSGGALPSMFGAMAAPADTLRAMIEGVSRLDGCTVVVSTSGVEMDTDGVPKHVHITDRLPQPLLLESVDLFLTHGGFNSIREAMRTATPMAVLPQFGDQLANAGRVQELGLGREVTDATPEGIAATCREVLADSGCVATARRARLEMLALPDIASAVVDLEKIAG